MKSPRARTAAAGLRRCLSLATGGGKTRVAAAFLERNWARRRSSSSIGPCSRYKLKSLRDYVPSSSGTETSASSLVDDRPTVYVATIQGCERRCLQSPGRRGLRCHDEAHHGAADSYLSLFAGLKSNASAKVLGLTATPFRLARDAVLGSPSRRRRAAGGPGAGP